MAMYILDTFAVSSSFLSIEAVIGLVALTTWTPQRTVLSFVFLPILVVTTNSHELNRILLLH